MKMEKEGVESELEDTSIDDNTAEKQIWSQSKVLQH